VPLRQILRQLRRGIPSTKYTRDYFLSESCDGFNEFQASHGLSYVKQQLVSRVSPAPGERILEIGSGRGEVLLACADRGADVFGVDYAADAVALTRDTCDGRAKVLRGDATSLPFRELSFSKVFLGDVLEHLTLPQARAMLVETHRILRPGGTLILHTSPNVYFMHGILPWVIAALWVIRRRSLARLFLKQYRASWEYHAREYSPGRLAKLFVGSPFQRVTVESDPDVLRAGRSQYTETLVSNPLVRMAARFASREPLLSVLGNDLWVAAVKDGKP
jgi:ubiquinone/menaquinone biosynthesis C-methylase UbiE